MKTVHSSLLSYKVSSLKFNSAIFNCNAWSHARLTLAHTQSHSCSHILACRTHMHVPTLLHACTHTCARSHTHTHTHELTRIPTRASNQAYIHACAHAHPRVNENLSTYACIRTLLYGHTLSSIHTHAHAVAHCHSCTDARASMLIYFYHIRTRKHTYLHATANSCLHVYIHMHICACMRTHFHPYACSLMHKV